jgi:hypothetical protein
MVRGGKQTRAGSWTYGKMQTKWRGRNTLSLERDELGASLGEVKRVEDWWAKILASKGSNLYRLRVSWHRKGLLLP